LYLLSKKKDGKSFTCMHPPFQQNKVTPAVPVNFEVFLRAGPDIPRGCRCSDVRNSFR
jgi:hypothetical protein